MAVINAQAALPTNTPSFTPTLTPTVTPLAAHYNQGSTRRTTIWGNSVACGWTCASGCSEGWEPALIAASSGIYLTGTTYVQNAVPVLTPQAYTSAAGGERITQTYAKIVGYMAPMYPSPANTDLILLGPALINDAANGMSQADMTKGMLACVTASAGINSAANICVIADPSWISLDNPAMYNAAYGAVTQAAALGYSRVMFIDGNACINATSDRCVAGVDPHINLSGNNLFGGCVGAQIPAP